MALRFLLRNWLHGAARDKIRERVGEGSRGDGDLSADVGIVFALSIEAGGTVDLLESFDAVRGHGFTARRGRRGERSIVVIESGSGGERAAVATRALIEAHRPRLVISAGFAGGLVAAVKRHDIVVADSLVNMGGERIDVEAKDFLGELPEGVHVGRILSVNEVVRRPSDKESLGRSHGALAVDLESFAVAGECRRCGVWFFAARVITDAMDEELPADVQRLTEQKTTAARLGAAVGAVYRRPASFKQMWRLKETAIVGSDRLARFLERVVGRLD